MGKVKVLVVVRSSQRKSILRGDMRNKPFYNDYAYKIGLITQISDIRKMESVAYKSEIAGGR